MSQVFTINLTKAMLQVFKLIFLRTFDHFSRKGKQAPHRLTKERHLLYYPVMMNQMYRRKTKSRILKVKSVVLLIPMARRLNLKINQI